MLRAGAAATLGCAAAVAALEVPDCEIHFIVVAWVEINQCDGRAVGNRHRHAIEQASHARAVKFEFHTGRRV